MQEDIPDGGAGLSKRIEQGITRFCWKVVERDAGNI
jgi:hypothetical protein